MENLPSGLNWRGLPGNNDSEGYFEEAEAQISVEMNVICREKISDCDWALFLSNDYIRHLPCGCYYDIIKIKNGSRDPVYVSSEGNPCDCPFFDDAVEYRARVIQGI